MIPHLLFGLSSGVATVLVGVVDLVGRFDPQLALTAVHTPATTVTGRHDPAIALTAQPSEI
jgi:hypothetical protein